MILGINEEKFLTQKDDYKGGFDYSETFYCPYLNFCTEKAPSKQPGLVNSTASLCWPDFGIKFLLQYLGLGEGVDRRGGVESRSDLPDLKSSKVDFKVDFLTKVE